MPDHIVITKAYVGWRWWRGGCRELWRRRRWGGLSHRSELYSLLSYMNWVRMHWASAIGKALSQSTRINSTYGGPMKSSSSIVYCIRPLLRISPSLRCRLPCTVIRRKKEKNTTTERFFENFPPDFLPRVLTRSQRSRGLCRFPISHPRKEKTIKKRQREIRRKIYIYTVRRRKRERDLSRTGKSIRAPSDI